MHIFKKSGGTAAIVLALAMLAACGGGGGDGEVTPGSPNGGVQPGDGSGTPDTTVAAAPKASYAYITQRGWHNQDGTIIKCKVDNGPEGNGALTECAESGAGPLPGAISLTFAGNNRVYVVNKRVGAIERVDKWEDINYTHSIWMCSLNPNDGTLSGCANTGEKESVHIDDFFVSGRYGYMLQKYGDMILRERYDPATGKIALLDTIQNIGLKEPVNYAVIPERNRVYIANSSLGGSSITLCTLNSGAGTFTGCADANASSFRFDPPGDYNGLQPTGIAINDNGSMAYIASKTAKNVISCTIGNDGRFTSCTANSLGVPVDIVNRVAVQDKYVYVTSTSEAANTGSLIKCEVAANGTLKDCASTGPTFDSGFMGVSVSANPDIQYTAIDSNGSDIKFLFTQQ